MIKISRLELENFRTYKNKQIFQLDNYKSGLILVSGKNEVDPDLQGNDVGKTTLFEAIYWCLYGMLSTGLKASNVGTWGEKNCNVSLCFFKDDIEYVLKRTWSPNGLKLSINNSNFEDTNQDVINDLLGDSVSFMRTVMLGQFMPQFFDLKPAEKLSVFTEIFKFDKWLEYSDLALDKERKINNKITSLDLEISNKDGQLKQLESVDYAIQIEEFEKNRIFELSEIQNSLTEYERRYVEIDKEKKLKSNTLDDLTKKRILLIKDIEKFKIKHREIKQKFDSSNNEFISVKVGFNNISEDLEYFNKVGGVCSNCKQIISKEHKSKEINRLQKNLKDKKIDMDKCKLISSNYKIKLGSLDEKIETFKSEDSKLYSDINLLKNILSNLSSEQLTIKNSIAEFEGTLNRIRCKVNPFKRLANENKQKIEDVQITLTNLYEKVEHLINLKDMCSNWKKWFKDIRLMQIQKYLTEFDFLINDNLDKLGLSGWSVKSSIDRKTKSNTILKGFVQYIKSVTSKDDLYVPIESWGGGVRQRLRLSVTFALIDLIRNRQKNECDIEVYDEPTSWMSEKGIEDLLLVLKDRANNKGKRIFIIDHRNFEDMGIFDDNILIRKVDGGSQIE